VTIACARPTGVTIIAILNIIGGILMVVGGLSSMALGAVLPLQQQNTVPGADASSIPADLLGGGAIAVGAVLLGLGVLSSIVAYGLLTGKSWAWPLTVVLAIISIVLNVISLVAGNVGAIVSIAISAVILYYMHRPQVKAYFGKAAPAEPSNAAQA
jgi:hypothetical protein